MNKAVEIKASPLGTYAAVDCLEESCIYHKECANHASAGDFRMEDGLKPRLSLRQGKVFCATKNLPYKEDIMYGFTPAEEHGYGCVLEEELVEEVNTFEI